MNRSEIKGTKAMMLTRTDYGTNDERYAYVHREIYRMALNGRTTRHRAYAKLLAGFFTFNPRLPHGYRLEYQIENGSILCAACALRAWRQGYDVSSDVTTDEYEPCHECGN